MARATQEAESKKTRKPSTTGTACKTGGAGRPSAREQPRLGIQPQPVRAPGAIVGSARALRCVCAASSLDHLSQPVPKTSGVPLRIFAAGIGQGSQVETSLVAEQLSILRSPRSCPVLPGPNSLLDPSSDAACSCSRQTPVRRADAALAVMLCENCRREQRLPQTTLWACICSQGPKDWPAGSSSDGGALPCQAECVHDAIMPPCREESRDEKELWEVERSLATSFVPRY